MNWKHWLKGLIAAVVNGLASGVTLILADPEKFNLAGGLPLLLKTSCAFGILAAANYLKQSPVPPDEATKPQPQPENKTQ